MKNSHHILAASAVALISTTFTTGCTGDESAPTRPRTQNVLAPDEKAQNNAFNRETETPKRDMPTSGREFPGQSRATPSSSPNLNEPTVITADAGNMNPIPYGNFRAASSGYTANNYGRGPVPPIPEKPAPGPAVGSTPVPGIALSIDHSWGEVRPLENYPHRAWPDTSTSYMAAVVKHKPIYYFNAQDHLPLKYNGGWAGGWLSNVIEIPWFYIQTAVLPISAILEPPLLQRTTERLGEDPVYHGYQPIGGEIIPSPTPGVIGWEYPFLKADTTNPSYDQPSTTQPATTQTQEIPPVAPTLDTPASTAPISH